MKTLIQATIVQAGNYAISGGITSSMETLAQLEHNGVPLRTIPVHFRSREHNMIIGNDTHLIQAIEGDIVSLTIEDDAEQFNLIVKKL